MRALTHLRGYMLRNRSLFLVLVFGLFTTSVSCSIIKKPPVKPTEMTYTELNCSEQDRNCIYEIISTMGEKGKLSLLFQQGHLRELGAQINHVHPLIFLSTIFSDAHLKSCMYYIWDDYFKRNGFLDGLAPSLTREAEKGKLNMYIGDFAKDIGVTPDAIQGYFDTRDWENLVLFLIHS